MSTRLAHIRGGTTEEVGWLTDEHRVERDRSRER
jgi:hypothetical protein